MATRPAASSYSPDRPTSSRCPRSPTPSPDGWSTYTCGRSPRESSMAGVRTSSIGSSQVASRASRGHPWAAAVRRKRSRAAVTRRSRTAPRAADRVSSPATSGPSSAATWRTWPTCATSRTSSGCCASSPLAREAWPASTGWGGNSASTRTPWPHTPRSSKTCFSSDSCDRGG